MTNDEKLCALWDEKQIAGVILRFGRALDTGNWSLYRNCLTDPLNLDFMRLTGHPEVRVTHEALVKWADRFFAPLRRHHVYTNFDISVTGDLAHALVYMTARHWKSSDMGSCLNTQYGWYDFGLERAGDSWLINRIKHDFQWVDGNGGLFDLHDQDLLSAMQAIFCAPNAELAQLALETGALPRTAVWS